VNLAGRTVLLTGATGGLGQAIARALAGRGATLVLTGRRADVLEPLAAEVGGRAVAADLAERDAPARLAADAGQVDVLVYNAGLPGSGELDDYTPEQIDRTLDVNLRAPMLLARDLVPAMAARREGHVVFISSMSGKVGVARSAIYSATKFGLRGFAQSLREDLRPAGVGVSTVFPGFIRGAGMFADSGASAMGLGTGRPDQVGAAVVKAIERGRTEVSVGPLRQRALAHFALSTPALSARTQSGAAGQRIAGGLAEGHPAEKR
jgi:uncharacterized protein